MKKVFSTNQIREADQFTIDHEPIRSIDLMERASNAFVKAYCKQFSSSLSVKIFCGPGNNGGDGLSIARLLNKNNFDVQVYILQNDFAFSDDFILNEQKLKNKNKVPLHYITDSNFPPIQESDVIIDALWGIGLTRPLTGLAESLVKYINERKSTTVSVDIPSGMFADKPTTGTAIQADFTYTFELPKLGFFFAENYEYAGEWKVLRIGLDKSFISEISTSYFLIQEKDIKKILRPRRKFDHKGKFGHALIVAGSAGKIGAALLCSSACLKSGAGLVTAHIPRIGNNILQTGLPDAMITLDDHENIITKIPSVDNYTTIGIGSGIGIENLTQQAFINLLSRYRRPMVIDADAINILSLNKGWLEYVPKGSIFTPHPKEFERLFGKSLNSFERIKKQKDLSISHKIVIVLKGAYTSISTPEGLVFFNPTGNPGMAKGGSGDVLTGMITAFLSQGYTSEQAAIMGVYLHGLAGNVALKNKTDFNITASDQLLHIANAFKKILH